MLLRVRFADGRTVRVSLEPGHVTQEALYAKIAALGCVTEPFSLFSGPALNAAPFILKSAVNGDFVFVRGNLIVDVDAESAANERSAAKAAAFAAASVERAAVNAAAATAAAASQQAGAVTSSMPDAGDSSAVPSDASAASAPFIELNNRERVGSAAEDDKNSTGNDDSDWKPRCQHGPRGMCEYCMPAEDKKSRYERELAKWKGRGMSIGVMEALEALKIRVKPQENAHVATAAVDNAAAAEFQAYLAKTSFSQQRLGICYGRFNASDKETNIFAIYEPPQRGSESTYQLVDGEDGGDISDRATKLALMLDLHCVGLVISARPRKAILSGKDIVVASKMLSQLSPEARKAFVVLLVSVTESGETAFEAYQLSDQALEMYEKDIFAPIEEQKPNGGRVITKENVLVESKETDKVHTEFFLINIPIKSIDGPLRVAFPVENRDLQPQSPADVKRTVDSSSGLSYGKRIADFHLLLFLSSFLDIVSDMPGLANNVKTGSDDVEEGYRILIDSMA